MVSTENPSVYGHKFSTVSTGNVTGDNVVHELTNMDLIMKYHYLRVVYFFKHSDIIDGLTIMNLKEPMFPVLDLYYPVTGRIRRTATGRPLIKCNDCGVRIVEAMCNTSIDEWLEMTKKSSSRSLLVPDKGLGPQLHFSPTFYIQFTKFKCGGISIGYSWAHVLGDPISAINCFNMWSNILKGNPPPKSIQLRAQTEPAQPLEPKLKPLSVKPVEPIGEHWLAPNTPKMSTLLIQITHTKLTELTNPEKNQKSTPFATISALIWYCLAKIRSRRELNSVVICQYDNSIKRNAALANDPKIGTVSLKSSPALFKYSELATLISKQELVESKAVQSLIDEGTGKPDFILYGASLTFVDMQGIEFDGFELKGQKPVQIDCTIDGIGDQGAVLVYKNFPSSGRATGWTVMVIVPEHEIAELEGTLKSEFNVGL